MGQGNSKCDGVHEKIRERVPAALLRGINAPSGPSAPGHGSDESAASGMPGVPRETRVKLVLLGDTGVGKSAIVVRFVQGEFSNESKVTVGAAFLAKALRIPEHVGDDHDHATIAVIVNSATREWAPKLVRSDACRARG